MFLCFMQNTCDLLFMVCMFTYLILPVYVCINLRDICQSVAAAHALITAISLDMHMPLGLLVGIAIESAPVGNATILAFTSVSRP